MQLQLQLHRQYKQGVLPAVQSRGKDVNPNEAAVEVMAPLPNRWLVPVVC
jgi:hypothetical protein